VFGEIGNEALIARIAKMKAMTPPAAEHGPFSEVNSDGA